MLGGEPAAGLVVERGEREGVGARVDPAQHLHRRDAGAADGLEPLGLVDVGGRDQEARDAMLDHRGDDLRLHRRGLVGVGDDGRVAALGEGHLRARRELGEERVPEVVDDKPDQLDVGARAGWRPCGCRRS